MTLVYRVEDEYGSGMYNNGAFWSVRDRVEHEHPELAPGDPWGDPPTHPGPERDGIEERIIREHHRFGFGSIEQLFDWIGPYMEGLREDGRCDVIELDIPEKRLIRGRRQVVYSTHDADLCPRIVLEWGDLIQQYNKIKEAAA